jgi:hypothetical protein
MNLKMISLSSCERDHPMLSAILSSRAISGELTRAEIVLSDVLMINRDIQERLTTQKNHLSSRASRSRYRHRDHAADEPGTL